MHLLPHLLLPLILLPSNSLAMSFRPVGYEMQDSDSTSSSDAKPLYFRLHPFFSHIITKFHFNQPTPHQKNTSLESRINNSCLPMGAAETLETAIIKVNNSTQQIYQKQTCQESRCTEEGGITTKGVALPKNAETNTSGEDAALTLTYTTFK
ncbi:hypothetical protein QBC40DRAFT_299385 [Triangularia verruculosa]|uniref:Uncharacterized protein n=1 Tax=Triangularia verruculosa TaxID=2587418 RepID=A0AAN6XC86_9PEZI|nr:hypothetical protein QBC40DRAFT_299385 [Triangularia verruculosa]